MIRLKSEREIGILRKSNELLARMHDLLEQYIEPGITTFELDRIAEDFVMRHQAIPAFKGYQGFPATLCTSINEQVVHGIPSKDVFLREGDIISIDSGVIFEGYYSDAARTHMVGVVSEETRRLCQVTEQSLWKAIAQCYPGNRIGDIGWAVESHAMEAGYQVVRDYVGHGIGRHLHELPNVPNYGPPGKGTELMEGLVLAIEPMVNRGTSEVEILEDGWTVVTADGSQSAHYEHSVAITSNGPLVLSESVSHPGFMTKQ